MFKNIHLKEIINGPAHILYHVGLIVLSASIALSLPYTADFIARKSLILWASIGNEKIFLTSFEISLAIILILLFNYIGRNWRYRRLAGMAKKAGLVSVSSSTGFLARNRDRRLKESNGIARNIMVIGSTGFRTFVDEKSDLHAVIRNCREARIMLLNPSSDGARIRAKGILDPGITIEKLREQIGKSIDVLKSLKAAQKNVRLKLYDEVPFLKMAISDDYVWVKHYHAGLDVQLMPEYVFRYNQDPGSLYVPFYEYFLNRWNDYRIPEYDLESDELIYRDSAGNEERREKFRENELTAVLM
ncbi:MAG: hypothetical protein P8013_02105 [Candidatus Sulfobium sp.]|jgi:hypothetical protein